MKRRNLGCGRRLNLNFILDGAPVHRIHSFFRKRVSEEQLLESSVTSIVPQETSVNLFSIFFFRNITQRAGRFQIF